LAPGVQKHIMDLRQTDDKMVVAIEIDEHTNVDEVTNILKTSGAEEVNTKLIEDWYKYKLG
jgi:23S rRNA U2552 (ribose-2'-O)-methylase RlmE/FtsJ